jgi:host factor-I protein
MTENLQDKILEDAKEKGIEVVIYLTRGNRIVGKVLDQDKYTVLLKSESGTNLIYKHAISTVVIEEASES